MPLTEIVIEVYAALLNCTGTNDPIPTILHNTLGTITWTRSATGMYTGTLTGAFQATKTGIIVQPQSILRSVWAARSTDNTITLSQKTYPTNTLTDALTNVFIEIRTYI